jgi:hypothetical protein
MKKQIDNYINFDTKCILKSKIPLKLEQECVQKFFENKLNGVYVDVGANHPSLNLSHII